MDSNEFVEVIKLVVAEDSINGTISLLKEVPGRSPAKDKVELSKWYHNLSENDQQMIAKVIRESVEMSVFGFLCVLDGVRAIEGIGDKGKLNLFFEKDGKSTLLNNYDNEFLHDLF